MAIFYVLDICSWNAITSQNEKLKFPGFEIAKQRRAKVAGVTQFFQVMGTHFFAEAQTWSPKKSELF